MTSRLCGFSGVAGFLSDGWASLRCAEAAALRDEQLDGEQRRAVPLTLEFMG